MKILIADKLSDKALNNLKSSGAEIVFKPGLGADDLAGEIKDAEVLIVRSTKVQKECIDAGANLSLIIRAGAGVNTIDIAHASQKGIHVANCPGKNKDAVAELAIGLMIAADRRIADATADLRDGVWGKKKYSKAAGLKDKTIGIIGLGSIGKAVGKIAKGMDMQVAAWSRSLTPEKAEELEITYCEDIYKLAETCDVISVHLAASKETKHLLNDKFFSAMKDNSIFLNTSRGEVVDTAALKKAIKEKGIKAGLDVFENEPAASAPDFADKELASLIVATPHIGASTDQSSDAIADEVVRVVEAFSSTGKPINAVNIQAKSPAVINMVVRHYNRVGVLAGVLTELRNGNINVEEMANTIFQGGEAAVCTLKLDSKPGDDTVKIINNLENVIQAELS